MATALLMLNDGLSPAAVAYSRTGAMLAPVTSVAAAEMGDVLSDGTFAISATKLSNATQSDRVVLYSPRLAPIVSLAVVDHGVLHPLRSNGRDRFYYSSGTWGATITAVNASGATVGIWTLAVTSHPVVGGTPNADDTIYYYTSSPLNQLRRHDLQTDSALADVHPALSAGQTYVRELTLTAAGDILAVVETDHASATQQVWRYSAAGALVSTYDLGSGTAAGGEDVIVARDYSEPETFWVRTDDDPAGTSATFHQLVIADGSVRREWTVPMGQGVNEAPASCPFLVVNADVWTPVGPVAPPTLQPLPPGQCAPKTIVTSGGTGAAGCNFGGVGYVPTPGITWGGVPNHPDPVYGETLTGKRSLDLWVELVHRK